MPWPSRPSALMFRYSFQMALTLGASLSQIGEFSFILAGLGIELKLLPEAGRDLILAGAILSILINPLLFALFDRLMPWLKARERNGNSEEAAIAPISCTAVTSLTGHAVLVGHGRVGSLIAETLERAGQSYLVIEERQEVIDQLQSAGLK